ncbi:hypothetical protein [Engelhardtia mirabilis]|uniref:Uncharacterized protein n=1 Tax=Engelhardtia mirabilis TaxID=2528011 RepID=A0A518BK35_9BACT|nr:hypothetical protein Pla133_24160 [Planctomycetes bacterium Pla133]QDV01660.1 hypothetical protein Pla86_24150 [Planctomycetes bacterium Pla86]
MTTLRFRRLAAGLALAAIGSMGTGCLGAATVAGAGYLVARELGPDRSQRALVREELEEVWFVAELLMDERAEASVDVLESPRRLVGRIDGATVEVTVERVGPEQTSVSILAQRVLARADAELAGDLLDALLARLAERNPGR